MARRRRLTLIPFIVVAMTAALPGLVAPASQAAASAPKDDTPTLLNPKGEHDNGSDDAGFDKLRDAYYWSPLLSDDGSHDAGVSTAAYARKTSTAKQVSATALSRTAPAATAFKTTGGKWTGQGPDPIVQNGRSTGNFEAVAGRISALAIRKDGTLILGAAAGGVWTYNATAGTWTQRLSSWMNQPVGALAIAPSNDNIVYMGSGEAALSGDSDAGTGIYRSNDGGLTWRHISTTFTGQSVSAIVVDPTKPWHLYASTVRGRGGNFRTSAPTSVPYGVWESTNGGFSWKLRKGTTDELHGATNLVMDPRHPNILMASFWGDGIYRSTNGGQSWTSALGDLPAGNFLQGGTRFALGLSDPAGAASATVYTGFDYFDSTGTYHQAQIWKSTDYGAHWTATGTGTGIDSIVGYCGTQCYYDNVLAPDPTNPNTVYALGLYGYTLSPPSGGIFRSTDGGATWKNLGYDLHPDYHAIAFQPNKTSHIAIGNDGGVWESKTGGGRNAAADPLSAADWQDLNGQVDPTTGALIHSTGLQITQFNSVATVPTVPGQYWGGTQDNGTLRKSVVNSRWFDQAGGDGGQVIVDQTTPNPLTTNYPGYVFGSYYSISPYRYSPDEVNTIFGNEAIDGGIDPSDRAEFYVPWTENRSNPNQMFYGTYRLYRTNNAEAPSAGDVTWSPISPDLTSGCAGAAPNGARGCLISTVALAQGGDGVYAGTDEGWIQVSADAVTAATPTWVRTGYGTLPDRPVDQIAVDRSNWRIAYAAYGGFDAATPGEKGHVFATADGGRHWRDITANLPDVPVDTITINPSDAKTLYAGTDIGPFVTTDGGKHWDRLGTDIPRVSVWQLDYDATNGVLLAGTHGRGAYTLTNSKKTPALVVSTTDSGTPVGPGSRIDYTVTVRNIGNAPATKVMVYDPVPQYTTPVSATGGDINKYRARWSNQTIPAGGSISLKFSVRISPTLSPTVTSITNDGVHVQSAQGAATTGSPHTIPIAPANDVTIAPTASTQGAKVGSATSFVEQITNQGYKPDSYAVTTSSGGWAASVYDSSCTTALAATGTVAPGATVSVCVKVAVPTTAADNARNDTTVTATSAADATATASATLTSIAVAIDTLLVDEDTNQPVDSAPYYETALTASHTAFSYWDLTANPNLPQSYLTAHKNVVWFTANSYPAPITPYEAELKAFLDGGGRLFMSGQDILDQAAGTTAFVHDYLHIDWDGSERQNDKETASVAGVTGNPVSGAFGTVPLDHNVLQSDFEDQITPIDPAVSAFTDDTSATDGLTVSTGGYKVVFIAFPFEAFGTAAQKAQLMASTFSWFSTP